MNEVEKWQNDITKKDFVEIRNKVKYLRRQYEDKQIDKFSKLLHEEAITKIDCLNCANCCKTTVTIFSAEDINRVSKFLSLTKKNFIQKYLINDNGEWTTITTPCPFLQADNKCKIYDVRPEACKSFPHTQKSGFTNRNNAHVANYEICPITYYVVNNIEMSIERSQSNKD